VYCLDYRGGDSLGGYGGDEVSIGRQRKLFAERFEAFLEFYAAHKEVYDKFVERALQMCEVREHYSARTIAENIRWGCDIQGGGDFKINNNHIPYLARLAMLRNEELKGFFQQRDRYYDVTDDVLEAKCDAADSMETVRV